MKAIGLARLGRDAELRFTPNNEAVCNLSLAVNYGKKGQDGNRQTQWIDASLWGKQAEALAPYLVKGSVHCFTLSDIHTETYQKSGGGEGVKLAARVDSVELGPRAEQPKQALPQQNMQQQGGYSRPQQQQHHQPAQQAYSEPPMNFDEDVPFAPIGLQYPALLNCL